MSTASQALLPIGVFGFTGGGGGSPPPNAGGFCFTPASGSSNRRAVELCATQSGFQFNASIHNNERNHRYDIEQDQQSQKPTDPLILVLSALRLFHQQFTHNGTRSNAITSKSTGK
jgi:hypothetical protein